MSVLPRLVVFDLDDCLWFPEMYHLWGGGGSPFTKLHNGNLIDRLGTELYLHKGVREVLHELQTAPQWENTDVAVASCCDEPAWAHEALGLFEINTRPMEDMFIHKEITSGSKSGHLKRISAETGVSFEEMVFFDDQMGNCKTVAALGVTVFHVPSGGVSLKAWDTMKSVFPAPGKVTSIK